jgi:hypothetical protein
MTSMADCIARGMDFGEIDRARGIAAQDQYQQLLARYSTIMPPGQAARAAAKDLKEATAKASRARYHKVVNQLQAMRRIKDLIESSPDPAVAIRNLLEHSDGSGFRGESVKSLTEAFEASINAGIAQVLELVGLNVVGSSPDFLARPDAESPCSAASVSSARQMSACFMPYPPPGQPGLSAGPSRAGPTRAIL